MILMKTKYAKNYPMKNHLLFIQLPTILIKKTTLHGYLSGDIHTIIEK